MAKQNDNVHGPGDRGEQPEGDERLVDAESDDLVCAPKALTKPERVRILAIANVRLISPSEYAKEHGKDLHAICHDFRVLRDDGYIELVEKVPVRGTFKHMYRATKRGLVRDAEWRLYNAAIKAGFREATLEDFVARCAEALAAGTFDARDDSNFSWKAIHLDEEGWIAFVKVMKRAYDEVEEIEAESADRADEGAVLFAATFAIAGFLSPEPEASEDEEGEGEEPEEPEEPDPKPKRKKANRGKGKGSPGTGKGGKGKGR